MSRDERGRDLALQAIHALPDEDALAALSWLVTAVSRRASHQVAAVPLLTAGPPSAGSPQLAQAGITMRNPITPREAQVLHLLGENLTVDQVAEQLLIGRSTVRNHLRNIISKADIDNEMSVAQDASAAPLTGAELTMLPVRLPRDQYAALKTWCAANKFSMATVVRGLVEKFLADQAKRSA